MYVEVTDAPYMEGFLCGRKVQHIHAVENGSYPDYRLSMYASVLAYNVYPDVNISVSRGETKITWRTMILMRTPSEDTAVVYLNNATTAMPTKDPIKQNPSRFTVCSFWILDGDWFTLQEVEIAKRHNITNTALPTEKSRVTSSITTAASTKR